ncbi:hypothetical protein HOD96_01215 [Candidatus Falkowbacteria bacterium]|nr:hypothetical protein [Candidatus Falkowbacteria bacterium]MBT4432939.1 hypothetical protein [Candidatus Falkowbacteria bacterium]
MKLKNLLKNKVFVYASIMELLFVLLIFAEYPLRKIFGDYFTPPLTGYIFIYFIFIFSGLIFFYFLIYKLGKNNKDIIKNNFKIIIFFFILFQLTLLIIPPLGSSDLYNYIYRTKVLTHYHENPFLVPPDTFPQDPLINLTWSEAHNTPLIYGPLWLGISILPTVLAFNDITAGVMLFKLLAILFSIISGFLIFKILARIKPDYKYLGFTLYVFNPLLLFEIANNGHNDIAMMFFVLLSVYFFLKEKYCLSIAILTLSVIIKFITILLLPILVLIIINKKGKIKEKIKFISLSILIFFTVIFLGYFLSGNNLKIFLGVLKQTQMSIFTHFSLFPLLLQTFFQNLDIIIIKKISNLAFIISYVIIITRILYLKNKDFYNLIKYFFLVFFLYFILASTWLMPWYFIWIIPLAVILNYNANDANDTQITRTITKFRYEKIIFYITTLGLMSYTFLIYPIFYLLSIVGLIYYFILKKFLKSKHETKHNSSVL